MIFGTRRFRLPTGAPSTGNGIRRCWKLRRKSALVRRRPSRSRKRAFKVLDTILRSDKGELSDEEEVSKAQLGAFFAAMTIRENAFPEATQWSEGETHAMNTYCPRLVRALPPDIIFIADPEDSIMGAGSSIGLQYVGNGMNEMRLVGALREVLAGGHLGYEEVQGVLKMFFH